MTTRIKITNEGPENAVVWYYNAERVFKQQKDPLVVGQSIEMDIWDGHLPVMLPMGHVKPENMDNSGRFYAIPPATY